MLAQNTFDAFEATLIFRLSNGKHSRNSDNGENIFEGTEKIVRIKGPVIFNAGYRGGVKFSNAKKISVHHEN